LTPPARRSRNELRHFHLDIRHRVVIGLQHVGLIRNPRFSDSPDVPADAEGDGGRAEMSFADTLKELLGKATPGPWKESTDGYGAISDATDGILYYDEGSATVENNQLIVALVNNAPALLKLIEAAEGVMTHHGSAARAVEQTGLRQALQDLDEAGSRP
jgi:hypothetical protein